MGSNQRCINNSDSDMATASDGSSPGRGSLVMLVPSCEKFKSAQSSPQSNSSQPQSPQPKKKSTLLRIATFPSASSAPLGADSHLKRKRESWPVVSCSRCILACHCLFLVCFCSAFHPVYLVSSVSSHSLSVFGWLAG